MRNTRITIKRHTAWQRPPGKVGGVPGIAAASFEISRHDENVSNSGTPFFFQGVIPEVLETEYRESCDPKRNAADKGLYRPIGEVMTETLVRLFMLQYDVAARTSPVAHTSTAMLRFHLRLFRTLTAVLTECYYTKAMVNRETRGWFNQMSGTLAAWVPIGGIKPLKRPCKIADTTIEFAVGHLDERFTALSEEGCVYRPRCVPVKIDNNPISRTYIILDRMAKDWTTPTPYLSWSIVNTRPDITEKHVMMIFKPYMPLLRMIQLYLAKTTNGTNLYGALSPLLEEMPFPSLENETRLLRVL